MTGPAALGLLVEHPLHDYPDSVSCRHSKSGAGVRPATAEYSASFGGSKDIVRTIHLATAKGVDALTRVLAALGVPLPEIETAIRVLRGSPHHDIRDVTPARDALRRLGLPK